MRFKICLVTSVWGRWHTDVFLRLNLRALLAPGNLPSLASMHQLTFVIFTTSRDRATIERSQTYQRLAALVPVKFERIDEREIHDPVMTQQHVWSRAIEHVTRLGTHIFFLPPDVIWSNASMQHIGKAMVHGASMIIIPWTIRVVTETFQPAIASCLAQAGDAGIDSRNLVALAFEHLHPLIAAYKRDSQAFPHHAEMLIDVVPKQGLLLRLLASTPTIYSPNAVRLSNNKLAIGRFRDDEIYFPRDSDEVFAASLAPLGKDFHFYDRPRYADPVTIGLWWHGYPSETNDLLVRASYRIHAGGIEPSCWRPVEQSMDRFLRRCVIAREGLTVWQAVRKLADCSIAVEALAGMLHTGSLARAVRGPGSRLVMLPHNDAFATLREQQLDRLMSRAGRSDLVALTRGHMALLSEGAKAIASGSVGTTSLQTDDGSVLELRRDLHGTLYIDQTPVITGPLHAGEHIVLIVSKLKRVSSAEPLREDSSLSRKSDQTRASPVV